MIARRLIALAAVVVLALVSAGTARADRITVFAAASMKNALDEIAHGFRAATGHEVAIAYAGSSAQARQIMAGAPADIFISANPEWMDVLERDGMIEPGTRFQLAGNRLVLIAHGTAAAPVALGPDLDLAGMLGQGRLAMALTEAVPAGIYGRAALTSLGLWDSVASKLAEVDNVRAALKLVSLNEVPFGIVYATDAAADRNVTVIATFPEDSHPPIVYPVARVTAGASPAAADFLAWLKGPEARAALARQGFTPPGE